ncbi:MAG TPA: L,D-transpeptidase [Gaiellaceae bacterium]|nr:L,D-transpeptidase [Gaiellaceae bacterium]
MAPVEALRRAGGGATVAQLDTVDLNGLRTVLAVDGVRMGRSCKPAWYHVELAVLPNGTAGWVPARAIHVYQVRSRIVVSLTQRRLRVYRSGTVVLETTVGIGAPSTPTPTGRFYVNERYVLSSSDGPFGPAALGISAHSTVLAQSWTENGPIALHGTNEPWSIGQADSHGCVHVPNDVMRRLFVLAPAGTPVVIRG